MSANRKISEYCGRGKLPLIVSSILVYLAISNRDL